jgi:formate hydrogenlyase transcriptional activator
MKIDDDTPISANAEKQLPRPPAIGTIMDVEIGDAELNRALFDLAQAISGHSDLEALCDALAASLRRVIRFDSLGLALHDTVRGELRVHAVAANRPYKHKTVAVPTTDENEIARVWREQKPAFFDPADAGQPWSDLIQEDPDVRLIILVPLSTGDRRLGILGFGFSAEVKPDDAMLVFLGRVASELAVSVDAFLTRKALVQERDRLRVLSEISEALVSKLPMDELLSAISGQLSRVVAHDFAAISLFDKSTGEIRRLGLHAPGGMMVTIDEAAVRAEGLPSGEALATGKPVVITSRPRTAADFERFPSPIYRKYGSRWGSSCSIPLIGVNGALGSLDILRTDEVAFTEDEVDLLVQVGRQVAIAVANSLAYQELAELKDRLATEKLYLEDEIRFDQNVGNMVGESAAFQAVMRAIHVVAPTDATVLIQGETGTGKELVARAIHDLSSRSKRSFIKVNCAAIPATLLESELFGHEKGSFTGAIAQKLGRFELAHQGTIFLDEIGEIPLELQSKLLRAVQEQEIERLGGNRTIRVDVRIIAATNRNLKQMVEDGKFRSDLYYRLQVFPLNVPPLRERREDISALIRFFTQRYANRMSRAIDEIPSTALEALTLYDWPGNIRELQNLVERSVILSPGRVLQIAIPDVVPVSGGLRLTPSVRKDENAERERILQALRLSGGKVSGASGAAAKLGMRRTTLQSRMKRLNIERQYR